MKFIKTAVKVIAIVATVASFIPGPWQPIAMIVAGVAGALSAALELASPTTRKARPTARGSPTDYRLDPNAGIPYGMGRTQHAGIGVKRDTWGTDNQYQGFTSIYSLGPINGIEAFTADRSAVTFSGGAALGALAGFMWLTTQLGLCPSPALATPVAGWPGVGSTFKLSGLAASNWVLKFDTNGKKFTGGPPQPGLVFTGVKVYDPRLDSTYPGGSGSCRSNDETTFVYSETPHLHALTYALGRYQNGKKRFGIGFPISSIDVSYFVNAANIDEANGWKVGGIIFSGDNKWNALKQIMEAGGGTPITLGAKLSGAQSSPKSSIATITSSEIVGRCSLTPTRSIRDRINTGIPRFRSEAHGWEYVNGDPCRVAAYVTTDAGERKKEMEWTLVQQAQQAAQLTYYNVYNAREMGPIELTLKMRWVGLKPGDCTTINVPELNLVNQKVTVIGRTFDVQTGAVSIRFQSETDAKHAAALAAAGTAPPVVSLAYDPDAVPAAPSGWTITTGALSASSGVVPSLRFVGGPPPLNVEQIEFAHRAAADTTWSVDGLYAPDTVRFDVSAVAPGSSYYGRVRYIVNGKTSVALTLGPYTVDALTASTATIASSIVGQGALATKNTADFSADVSGATKPANNATVGADVNTNVVDTFTGTAITVPRNEIRTPLGTAAAIAGQGALATQNSLAYGGTYLSGFGTLAARASVRFGNEVYRANGSILVNDVDAVTSLGTAASISGQGTLATLNQVTYGTGTVSGFGTLAARANVRFGNEIYRANGSTLVNDVDAVTSLGTAASISGQGSLATLNSLAYGGAYLSGFGTLAARNNARIGAELYRADGTTLTSDAMLVTSAGTAAAIAGQGPFATFTDGTPQALSRNGINLFPYPRGTEDGRTPAQIGWLNAGATSGFLALARNSSTWLGGGYYSTYRTSGSAVDLLPSYDIIWNNGGGHPVSVSCYGYCGGAGATFAPYVEFRDVTNTTALDNSSMVYNATTDRWQTTATTPANTVYIRVVMKGSFAASGAAQELNFTTIKVERNVSPTPYSDPPDMLTLVGGYRRLADQRNVVPINSAGVRYYYNQNPTFTASVGTPATATISLAAGILTLGTATINYSAMSVGVTGTGGTSATYQLYIDDANYQGGSQTLVATTSTTAPYGNDARIFLGQVTVVFPTSGSGSGGGTGGGGGGFECPWADAFVHARRGWLRARDVEVGDELVVLGDDRESLTWAAVERNVPAFKYCHKIKSASGYELIVSDETPLTLRDGSSILPAELNGHELPIEVDGELSWEPCHSLAHGAYPVAHISCHMKTFSAGNVAGQGILTHNLKA